jgi:D-glycero-D-manno-heptose 1,7-bisphosphate phosphatase
VFLDRDGTINEDTGHMWRIEEFKFLRGVPAAIARLNQAGFMVIVVTNQSGVGRGLYTEADVERLHGHVNAELARCDAHIDEFYFCPHHPTEAQGEYRKACGCRKPEPGMLEQAIREHDIARERSFMVGDNPSDMAAGRQAGVRTIMVGNGFAEADYYCADLPAAVDLVLNPALE